MFLAIFSRLSLSAWGDFFASISPAKPFTNISNPYTQTESQNVYFKDCDCKCFTATAIDIQGQVCVLLEGSKFHDCSSDNRGGAIKLEKCHYALNQICSSENNVYGTDSEHAGLFLYADANQNKTHYFYDVSITNINCPRAGATIYSNGLELQLKGNNISHCLARRFSAFHFQVTPQIRF